MVGQRIMARTVRIKHFRRANVRPELSRTELGQKKVSEVNMVKFMKDSFNFTKGFIGKERSGRLHCPTEEV